MPSPDTIALCLTPSQVNRIQNALEIKETSPAAIIAKANEVMGQADEGKLPKQAEALMNALGLKAK